MSADDNKTDPIADTVAGLTPEQLREMSETVPGTAKRRKVDPLATTQPEGLSAKEVDAYAETKRHRESSERITTRIRAQTPTPTPTPVASTERTTMPARPGHFSRADTADPAAAKADINPLASTLRGAPSPVLKRRVSYPPTSWDRHNDVITSAQREVKKSAGADSFAGDGIEPGNMRLDEDAAREIVNSRFAVAGIELETDYSFRHDDLMVTLDGYDPSRRVGYAFLSHSDADVVTDFDEATELAFEELAGRGVAWVLVLHDTDVPVIPALEERLTSFLDKLPSS